MALLVPRPPPIEFNHTYTPRSVISRTESLVLFVNTTTRRVNIYWLDFNGEEAFYLALKPGGKVKVNTYCYHPWVFRDFNTGQLMHVLCENIFWPLEYKVRDPRNRSRWINCRMHINIHLPVRSLKEMCTWKVASILHKAREPKHLVQILPIPRSLKTDLNYILDYIIRFTESKELVLGIVRRNLGNWY